MIGQRFGRLTVVQYAPAPRPVKARGRWVVVSCDCGAVKTVKASCVKQGGTTSCGCYGREQASKALKRNNKHFITGYRKPPGVAAVRQRINHYKANARSRGLKYDLSDDFAERLMRSRCHYCGAVPSMKSRRSAARGADVPQLFNGIDRVDNALGYVVENVVPCCPTCNHMKSDRNHAEWIRHMRKILKHVTRLVEFGQ